MLIKVVQNLTCLIVPTASANSEANVLSIELAEERQRAADFQQQLDASNSRLIVTERNLQQVNIFTVFIA